MKCVLFTDLDGTLLDHHSYECGPAKAWLKRLRGAGVPVVINTSKTFEEVRALQKVLDITAPFGVENGGAIYYPPGFAPDLPPADEGFGCEVIGAPADRLLAFLDQQTIVQSEPLSRLSTEAIAQKTGLSPDRAQAAKARRFSQPFFLISGDLAALQKRVKEAGLGLLKGGRFWHLVAAHQDKGRVLRAVTKRYEAQWGEPVRSIALGDSPNDFAMLDAADIAILVARHDGTHSDYDRPDCRRMTGMGPAGWAEAMAQLRDEGVIDA